jgi:TatD DNase family protein
MGFKLGVGGSSTFKNSPLPAILREIALSDLVLETDSPYLAPMPHRGKRNEPAYVVEVARTLAIVRDLAPDEVAAATAANFRRFFRLGVTEVHKAPM